MKKLVIEFKDYDDIEVDLFEDIAPLAVKSIAEVSALGKYRNIIVERLEPDFVFQPLFQDGKDPDIDSILEPEFRTVPENGKVRFKRGIVAMAGDENRTSGSQLFITLKEKERLNGNFTVIGEVSKGKEILDILDRVPVNEHTEPVSGFIYHKPAFDIVIEDMYIVEKK